MADPAPGATLIPAAPAPAAAPAAPKPAVSPAPATPAQPTPAAAPRTGVPVAPVAPIVPAAAPASSQVPLAVLMEERDKRQQLQAELDALKNVQRQQPAPGFQAPPQQPQADLRAQLDQLWQTDPRKAVQTEIALAAQWSDNVNAQVDGEAEALSTKYKDFNDYRNTAMRYVRALPLDQRARPGIVEMAYLVTRGQNVDQIIETQRQAMATQFQQNPAMFQTPAGSSAGSITPSNSVQATEAQERAARAMKMPIDQYMKWVK